MKISGRFISTHNLDGFEHCLNDFQKECLKLRLVYDYIRNHGFTCEADSLMGECVSYLEQYLFGFSVLFECVSNGHDMNPDD